MYYCSICEKPFESKDEVAKHFLRCWKKTHPYAPPAKSAPRSEDINTREVSADIASFFKSFDKE
jgi:hypothetical protein